MSGLSALPADHDLEHLKAALRLTGERNMGRLVAVDVGACTGIWTAVLAQHFLQVYAFEPVRANYVTMAKRVVDCGNVKPYLLALGADSQPAIALGPGKENIGQWHKIAGDNVEDATYAHQRPLDMFEFPADFLKIDVEGMELEVLQGAEQTISTHKPAILLELNGLGERYGHKDAEVRAWLEDRGYRFVHRWNKDYLFWHAA